MEKLILDKSFDDRPLTVESILFWNADFQICLDECLTAQQRNFEFNLLFRYYCWCFFQAFSIGSLITLRAEWVYNSGSFTGYLPPAQCFMGCIFLPCGSGIALALFSNWNHPKALLLTLQNILLWPRWGYYPSFSLWGTTCRLCAIANQLFSFFTNGVEFISKDLFFSAMYLLSVQCILGLLIKEEIICWPFCHHGRFLVLVQHVHWLCSFILPRFIYDDVFLFLNKNTWIFD